MQAVGLFLVLFTCFFTSGKSQSTGCEKSHIDRPNNVDLSSMKDKYNDKESVRIRCEIGYTGFYRATCRGTEWSVTGRACQKKPCGHPGDTPNGDFHLASGDDFVFGAVVEYTCKNGYRMMSRNRQRSCMSSGWDNDIPVCEEVKCPVIRLAGNLRASGNFEDGGYGDVIHFECPSQKMQLLGPEEIHCTEEGKWSGDIPTCREIQCEPPVIAHGRILNVQPVYKDDDLLRYTCDAGHKTAEGRSPRCSKHGWTATPECEEINCRLSHSVSPETRRLPEGKNIFRPGEEVQIVCDEGHRTFTKKERDSFLCGQDGEWPNKRTPGCEKVYCSRYDHDQLAHIYWSYWQHQYMFDEALNYYCSGGYTKTAEKATCKIDGWNPKRLCVDANACATPTIENGFVVEHDRDTVGFSCNSGFKLNTGGEWKKSSCSRGVWSVTPKCIGENECAAPPAADHVTYKNEKDTYAEGESQEFECEPGYTSQLAVQFIKCTNGQWEKAQCKRDSNSCASPPDVENGIIVSPYKEFYENGAELKYACRLSFGTEGGEKVICNAGNWTDPPTCIPQNPCDAPHVADNVKYLAQKESYLHGEFLQFECEPGYTSALQHIKCQNGTWDNPFCTRDYNLCTAPPRVENGSIISPDRKIYEDRITVEYRCERFHKFKDVDTITCRLGAWTDVPECIPRDTCDKPEGKHMTLIPDQDEYNNGDNVRYMCTPPFTAKQGRQIACVSGRWSAEVDCALLRYHCLPPSPETFIGAVERAESAYAHGRIVKFKCPDHYIFSDGQQEITNYCDYEHWRYRMTCLKPCHLTRQDMDERNIEFKKADFDISFVKHNDRITFKCRQGTELDSRRSMTVYCKNGIWEWDLPRCQ